MLEHTPHEGSGSEEGRHWEVNGTRQWSRRVDAYELLRPEEEVALALEIKAGLDAASRLEVEEGLDPAAIQNLRLIAYRGEKARDDFIKGNLRLVAKIAGRYKGRGLPYDDLVQEGSYGLLKAVERFEPTQGYKFSTLATTVISRRIIRAIADQSRTIRVAEEVFLSFKSLADAEMELLQAGIQPTTKAIADCLGVSVKVIKSRLEARALVPVSLDKPLGAETEVTLHDTVGDSVDVATQCVESVAYKGLLRLIREGLTDKQYRIFQLRYLENPPWELAKIGAEFGVSGQAISVTHKKIKIILNTILQKAEFAATREAD